MLGRAHLCKPTEAPLALATVLFATLLTLPSAPLLAASADGMNDDRAHAAAAAAHKRDDDDAVTRTAAHGMPTIAVPAADRVVPPTGGREQCGRPLLVRSSSLYAVLGTVWALALVAALFVVPYAPGRPAMVQAMHIERTDLVPDDPHARFLAFGIFRSTQARQGEGR